MARRMLFRGANDPVSDSALTIKLEGFAKLSLDDRNGLIQAISHVRVVEPRRDLISEGERPSYVHAILDGWAAAYKSLSDGKRQIVGFSVPGDVCDANAFVLARMDHSIGAITRLKVAMISTSEMARLTLERPRLTQALWWEALVTAAIRCEWILSIGQRGAYARLAHLLVELYLRLKAIGRAQDGRCDFPLTQNDLADATGLTAVHVNRTLQELRRDGLIELERKQLHIIDLGRLIDVAMFNANYLHLQREGRHLDSAAERFS